MSDSSTIATSATASYALSHGGSSPDAVVHGFTSAFTVAAGIFVAAAVVLPSVEVGGTEVQVTRLAVELGARGHQVAVLATEVRRTES